MLSEILMLILDVAVGILSMLLIVRFFMQWKRIPFNNSVGHFIVTATDWLVRPSRRIIPGWAGLDWASLVPAWLLYVLMGFVGCWLMPLPLNDNLAEFVPVLFVAGAIRLLIGAGWLLFFIVLISAVMSWFAPHSSSQAVHVCRAVAGIFLRPFRRVIPLMGGIDLSPLALLLLLQILYIIAVRVLEMLTSLLFAT